MIRVAGRLLIGLSWGVVATWVMLQGIGIIVAAILRIAGVAEPVAWLSR